MIKLHGKEYLRKDIRLVRKLDDAMWASWRCIEQYQRAGRFASEEYCGSTEGKAADWAELCERTGLYLASCCFWS